MSEETQKKLLGRRPNRGFAIVLVAALAGLVFLLGASLVVLSQLQGAASNYDQNMRLAREHARASLEMAIGELQKHAGIDQAVTYRADSLVPAATETEVGTVLHPYWTAAHRDGNDVWLVTRSMASTSPSVTPYTTLVESQRVLLIGPGTAQSSVEEGSLDSNIFAPKEPIVVTGLEGYVATDEKTIGNYGYWVGDLGVKASYALYDKTDDVNHAPYALLVGSEGGTPTLVATDRQARLRQMRMSKPSIKIVDTERVDEEATLSNPERINLFISDFQFREPFGDTEIERFKDDQYLLELDTEEALEHFHDFTPLSRGLLTNSASGGWREDLSTGTSAALDSEYVADYLPYVRSAKDAVYAPHSLGAAVFPITPAADGKPAIMPVITGFNLNYSLYLIEVAEGRSKLYLSFNTSIELWNPFTSSLIASPLRITITGLPTFRIWDASVDSPLWSGDLSALPEHADFLIKGSVGTEDFWRPGQIAVFSGPTGSEVEGSPPFPLSFGNDFINSEDRVIVDLGEVDTVDSLNCGFISPIVPKIEVRLHDDNALLATYSLSDSKSYSLTSHNVSENLFTVGAPTFGFSWHIADSVLFAGDGYSPLDATIADSSLGLGFSPSSADAINRAPTAFASASEANFLGYNPTDFGSEPADPDVPAEPIVVNDIYDLPFLQLPKQELTSVSHLATAFNKDQITGKVGSVLAANNGYFDKYFFSTVPESGTDWDVVDPLLNSGYVPVPGATRDNLRESNPAGQLYVHGMFNVHSTSIKAWEAMLKGSPASDSAHWKSILNLTASDEELYLFFNYPQSAEDLYDSAYDPTSDGVTSFDEIRFSMRQGMIGLTADQVGVLSKHIVSNIRMRVQGEIEAAPPEGKVAYDAGNSGPFTSLEDFVESGVLANAIIDADLDPEFDESPELNPEWVLAESAREFRQSTILNMIAPYISVRSDTFLVRAYGDAVNPAAPDEVWARAYCEAVVQRVHEAHATFGRKLRIVAFRWMSQSEI